MRVTFVSAHYPPNFVSGGTLQPQRLAHGLFARGHDVRVYAGHLDSRREPLDAWTERDDRGMPVHWLVTSPWIDWADERNHDNPDATRAFAAHLAEHPAEVVHLHSLQGLGVGLVEAARHAGARTVVTMHDFWWVCARQFLVERDGRPCCLVVSAGDCACEDGRAHLDRRTARLRDALQSVDLVLAPSRSAAEVLRANGVPGDRLRVDENGMLAPEPGAVRRRPRAPGDAVIARYTGGSNPMKGADVLLDAAHELGRHAGLRIVAHDIDDAVARDRRDLDRTLVEPVPAYRPEELDAVLADTDVLLLPSVMRESHSIVTREALLRGVPVITTDTIGPEEVVVDGTNGLVVPAGDAHLLAGALRTVVDGGLLPQLTAGAGSAPPVRSIADQVAGLEETYEELLAADAGETGSASAIDRVVFVVGIDGAPARYRAYLPAEALGLLGVATDVVHYRDPRLDDLLASADAAVVYRVPATRQVLHAIEQVRGRGIPVVFDVDDLIFDPDIAEEIPALRLLPDDEACLWLEGVHRYRTTMEACDAFIGSTPRLVEHAREVVGIDAHLFENGVGMVLGAASDIALRSPRAPGPPRVGYFSGTTTHDDDWRFVEAAVVEAVGEHPGAELWLGGHLAPTEPLVTALGERLRRLPFVPWHELPAVLRQVDVNLAPLEPSSRFNDAKSAIKVLEAAMVATPTIASPSAPLRDAIEPGRTGWLAGEPDEWRSTLAAVLGDGDERTTVGARAQRAVLLRWSPHLQGRRYLDILEEVRRRSAGPRRTPSSSWVPTVHDEPASADAAELDPYPPPLHGSTRARRRPRRRTPARVVLRVKLERFREARQEDGVAGVVRGAGRVAARVARRALRR